MLKDMVAVEKFQFVHQITEIRDGLGENERFRANVISLRHIRGFRGKE